MWIRHEKQILEISKRLWAVHAPGGCCVFSSQMSHNFAISYKSIIIRLLTNKGKSTQCVRASLMRHDQHTILIIEAQPQMGTKSIIPSDPEGNLGPFEHILPSQ